MQSRYIAARLGKNRRTQADLSGPIPPNFRIAEDYRPILIELLCACTASFFFSFAIALPSFPGVSFMSILVGPWLWP
jgi:hypothetical protein